MIRFAAVKLGGSHPQRWEGVLGLDSLRSGLYICEFKGLQIQAEPVLSVADIAADMTFFIISLHSPPFIPLHQTD